MITTEIILALLTLTPKIQLISPSRDCTSARINLEIQACVQECLSKVSNEHIQESNGPDFLPSTPMESQDCWGWRGPWPTRSFPLDTGDGTATPQSTSLQPLSPGRGCCQQLKVASHSWLAVNILQPVITACFNPPHCKKLAIPKAGNPTGNSNTSSFLLEFFWSSPASKGPWPAAWLSLRELALASSLAQKRETQAAASGRVKTKSPANA